MSDLIVYTQFAELVNLIKKSRFTAMQVVNSELINLYLQIGEYITKRIESEG